MRYVIVNALNGKALKFHDKLTTEVCSKFNLKRTKLPGHITLKAPFESENIDELINMLESLVKTNNKAPISVHGYDHFRNDVVFMKTIFSKEANGVYNEFYKLLKTLSWLQWKKNEDSQRIFHTTIVSKKIKNKFNEIWEYINEFQCNFHIYFDNISIYIWEENTWRLYKKFLLKDNNKTIY